MGHCHHIYIHIWSRWIVLYRTPAHAPNHNQTTHIHELHPMYDPAAYPLILPHGDAGFSLNNPIAKVNAPSTRATVSLQEFTRFHLQQKTNSFNTLLKSGKLAQVYFCDQYSKIEGRRMHYYKTSAWGPLMTLRVCITGWGVHSLFSPFPSTPGRRLVL